MPAVLTINDTVVAEWTGSGAAPWPVSFTPDGATAALNTKWPFLESETGNSNPNSSMFRGYPTTVAGFTVKSPFYIFRGDLLGTRPSPWGSGNSIYDVTSYVATTLSPNNDPVAMVWSNCSRVVFKVTDVANLRAESASVSAKIESTGAAYPSGGLLSGGNDNVIITAAPLSDGEGHDGSTLPSKVFWKWVCAETSEEILDSEQITIPVPAANTTRTYTAFWRPNSVKVEVEAGDNGVEVAHYSTAGLYYCKDGTGEPAMPMFYAKMISTAEAERSFDKWTKTVYTLDPATGVESASAPVDVATAVDPAYPTYEAVQTVRETDPMCSRVVYRAYSTKTGHDRVAAAVANTYLLKNAGYTLAPTASSQFGVAGYAGAYSFSYNQPVTVAPEVTYSVKCRRAGNAPAGEFTGAYSNQFTDSNTGKLWTAQFILFAVNAAGDPVDEGEDDTVPEDPDDPDLPGGGGGGGGGQPVGTSISLQVVSNDAEVTGGVATMKLGPNTVMTVTYPTTPVAVKAAAKDSVYMLTVANIAPTFAKVLSVTVNGTVLAPSGTTWAIVAGTGATSVVVTLGLPLDEDGHSGMRTLVVNTLSYPAIVAPATDNAVTVSPAAQLTHPDRWAIGTVLTLTPVPVTGYSNVLWQRDDVLGFHDEEVGGTPYAFALDVDTVVTAGFRKPPLSVVLTVKGSEALAAKFDWTYEEATADDTVPAEMVHALFTGTQLGIFKIGTTRLQTAGDLAYNSYVDMPVKAVDVSYDGGVTWVDAGGAYPNLYTQQTAPANQGRPAARIGKHTVTQIPLDDTLHVRVRLVATVSVSVGMPPVRWGGPNWQAAGSMIGTGQNNWACGFGAASISGPDGWDGASETVTMQYFLNTLANPTATIPLATLTAEEETPYPSYFNEYPWLNIELGDSVSAVSTPASGFFFVAWIDGYFSHDWEDATQPEISEDRLVWPAANYLSTDPTATIVVDQGMKKVMLRMRQTIALRWVLFTQDDGFVLATRPGESEPEQIKPSVLWAYYKDTALDNPKLDRMRFVPIASATLNGGLSDAWNDAVDGVLATWNVTNAEMEALGLVFYSATLRQTVGTIWRANISNVSTLMERLAFNVYLSWGYMSSERFDGATAHPAYLGVYRRVHLTNADGDHEVGEWEFVGRGEDALSYYGDYAATKIPMSQRFFADLEYRVRWIPYTAPTTTDEPYMITVGYQQLEDMQQGGAEVSIAGVSSGEINVRLITPEVQPGNVVIIKATPRAGFVFVSWVNATGVAVSTEAEHTIDPDTEGYTFLANFTVDIVEPPVNTTLFHVGFVAGNAGRGSILVRIWRDGAATEDYTVTAQAGATYQLLDGDNAYVVAVAATGWDFKGWVNALGQPQGDTEGYYPLQDSSEGGTALHRDVFFAQHVDPPITGNVPFRAGFLSLADVPYALVLVSVNGELEVVLNGEQYTDMMLTEGDSVSLEVIATAGWHVAAFVDLMAVTVSIPVVVQNVAVTGQGVLAVLGLDDPPIDPPPDVDPGRPATGAGLWLFDAGTENKAFVWRSRRFETPTPTEFNSVKVCRNGSFFPTAVALRVNAYSSPEVTSSTADIALAITNEAPRRLPKIRRERYFEIEVTAKDDIECIKIASSMGELQNG